MRLPSFAFLAKLMMNVVGWGSVLTCQDLRFQKETGWKVVGSPDLGTIGRACCKLGSQVKTTVPDSDIDKFKHLDVRQHGGIVLRVCVNISVFILTISRLLKQRMVGFTLSDYSSDAIDSAD